MHKIIGIITTRNRSKLFECAIRSVYNQTKIPDEIIVCSDSTDESCISFERKLSSDYGATYVRNNLSHNCSGVRNMAVMSYIQNHMTESHNFGDTYIAFLDDDDVWMNQYIEKCSNCLSMKVDFVICGIVFCNSSRKIELSISNILTIEDFLIGNPHIQGSNIFIKLTTLLKCGLFDENLSSSVDRDLFVRIMQLMPHYSAINEHLVLINTDNDRERITNNIELKKKDLANFYRKYANIMSPNVKKKFHIRNKTLFNIEVGKHSNSCLKELPKILNPTDCNVTEVMSNDFRLLIGVVISNHELGLRFLKDIENLKLRYLKIVIIKNYEGYNLHLQHFIQSLNLDYQIVECKKIIKEISTARNLLFSTLSLVAESKDIIWILDDDMQLSYLAKNRVMYKTNILDVIKQYKGKYDAVIGDYTLDAPLPVMSTLRTKLLDYMYSQKMKFRGMIEISNLRDYYYDISERTGEHLETPFEIENGVNIDDVFSGKATSRPLYFELHKDSPAINCGGNVLIFNHKLLDIKHLSLSISTNKGRRSDFFWVLESLRLGYSISNVAFATLHNRESADFDYSKELNKLINDIIGSSCTKTILELGVSHNYKELSDTFIKKFQSRTTKFIVSYYRIIGLLNILEDSKYTRFFNERNLTKFVDLIVSLLDQKRLSNDWENLIKIIENHE